MILLTNPNGETVHTDEATITEVTFVPHQGPNNAKSMLYQGFNHRLFIETPEEVIMKIGNSQRMLKFLTQDTRPVYVWVNARYIDRVLSISPHSSTIVISPRMAHLGVQESKESIDSKMKYS